MKLFFLTSWNTGRMYTEQGQRLGVWLILGEDQEPPTRAVVSSDNYVAILMVDYDRGLDYIFLPPRTSEPRSIHELRDYVMRSYDYNENKGPYIHLPRPPAPTTFPAWRW